MRTLKLQKNFLQLKKDYIGNKFIKLDNPKIVLGAMQL